MSDPTSRQKARQTFGRVGAPPEAKPKPVAPVAVAPSAAPAGPAAAVGPVERRKARNLFAAAGWSLRAAPAAPEAATGRRVVV